MLYELEFVRYVGDQVEALAHRPVKLIDHIVRGVIAQADELLSALVPRPNAYRLRAANGTVVYVSGTANSLNVRSPRSDAEVISDKMIS